MLEEIQRLSQHYLTLKNSPYRRYFIKKKPFQHRMVLVLGQRGVGKTTTLVQHLLDQVDQNVTDPSILYLQADHYRLGDTPLYEVAEQFQLMGGKYLALDEIHKYRNWSQELKSIYDTFPELHVVVSGSSALEMYKGSHDLSRRAIRYQMAGLSFREFLELSTNEAYPSFTLEEMLNNHEKIALEIVSKQKILPLFYQYLDHGYYPYFKELESVELYRITLEQNIHTTLEADLVAIHPHLTGLSIAKIKKFLVFISANVPFTPNWKQLCEHLDIGDQRTVKTYFKLLEDAGIIRALGSSSSKLAGINAPEKVYLDNPNQMVALASAGINHGTMREIFFLDMIQTQHQVTLPSNGDFLVDGKYLFEIGGRKKGFNQIKGKENSYLACDNLDHGAGKRIPLWLFGLMY